LSSCRTCHLINRKASLIPRFSFSNSPNADARTQSNLLIYPNKWYKIDTNSGTTTKHIFTPTGELIATAVADGKSTSTYWIHTDHLGGSSVLTGSTGEQAQLLDYYPFGDIRINENDGHD
jgi:hypothetical protein